MLFARSNQRRHRHRHDRHHPYRILSNYICYTVRLLNWKYAHPKYARAERTNSRSTSSSLPLPCAVAYRRHRTRTHARISLLCVRVMNYAHPPTDYIYGHTFALSCASFGVAFWRLHILEYIGSQCEGEDWVKRQSAAAHRKHIFPERLLFLFFVCQSSPGKVCGENREIRSNHYPSSLEIAACFVLENKRTKNIAMIF